MNATLKKIMTSVALFGTVAATSACSERFEENETGFRLNSNGAVKRDVTGPDRLCFIFCNPFDYSIKYKTFTDTFTISTNAGATTKAEGAPETVQARPLLLRTVDDKFVDDISLAISYEVVAKSSTENKKKLRSEFRAESDDVQENMMSIRDDIQIEAIQPTVDIIGKTRALDIQKNGTAIGAQIQAALQAAIDRRLGIGSKEISPINVKGVKIAGVAFDKETEATLRQVSLAEERGRIAEVAQRQAAGQTASASEQAKVTAGIFNSLKGAVPENQAASAVCLDMLRQKIIPESTNCFPGLTAK